MAEPVPAVLGAEASGWPVVPSGGRHASEEFRQIAEAGEIFRCTAGSALLGTGVSDQADRDEIGICIEPPGYVIGHMPFGLPQPFEQYIYRDQPEWTRSRAGDLDLTIYSLRKWLRLAMVGNPNMLLPLFAPPESVITVTPPGDEIQALAPLIVSRMAADRFAGYLDKQRESLLSHEGKGRDVTRPELVAKYGWDVKYGSHMVRLGFQGVELLETGRITLPMPEWQREIVTDIRTGRVPMERALMLADQCEARLAELAESSPLRAEPDREAADAWLVSAYLRAWAGTEEKAAVPCGGHAERDPEPCQGFQWIGQSFATCDGCGKPAWEHEGEMRLREGATLLGGKDDWELRPWKPGEADAIKRKWGGS